MRIRVTTLFFVLIGILLYACGITQKTPTVSIATAPMEVQETSSPFPLLTETVELIQASTTTPTKEIVPSETPVMVPVSNEVTGLFLNYFVACSQVWNVNIKLLDLTYEKNLNGDLTLKAAIQCSPSVSPCKPWMSTDPFIGLFSDPEPQPEKMSLFPMELVGFKVYGYGENMNPTDSIAGKWSDLVEYEKRLMSDDEFYGLLYKP
jgi:hypothetical protein